MRACVVLAASGVLGVAASERGGTSEDLAVDAGRVVTTSTGDTKAVKIGGLKASHHASQVRLKKGDVGFSAEVGQLDNTPNGHTADGYVYGDRVGNGLLRVGVTDRLTVTGQAQNATALREGGLGARYELGRWGVLEGATMRSAGAAASGQRHRYAYSVRLDARWQFGVSRDEGDSSFRELSSLHASSRYAFRCDTLWAATSTGLGGTVKASYAFGPDAGSGNLRREVALAHEQRLARDLAFSVRGSREFSQDSYAVTVKVSMPIETLLRLVFASPR